MIYLDHAATTKMSDLALKTYTETAARFFGNTESLHDSGTDAARLLAICRKRWAELLEVPQDGLIFTSGGTESNQLAIETILLHTDKKEIVVSPLEHASIWQKLTQLEDRGYHIRILPVSQAGEIDLTALEKLLSDETALMIVQHVHSETGAVQDADRLQQLAKEKRVFLHMDLVQGFGKADFRPSGVTSFSISSHKIYGPKGTGLLYLNPAHIWQKEMPHVHHENGYRAGTVDLPAISAFTAAACAIMEEYPAEVARIGRFKKQLLQELDPQINVLAEENGSPYILGMILPHALGEEALLYFNERGLQISTVSACSLRDPEPSRALLSMGYTKEEAERFIRFSFGASNRVQQIEPIRQVLTSFLAKGSERG
ncbi:cysteine desulfurase family protein [Listeria costaricensis]|uniref:cysteine desulfurase family protein n=1 Tax=Listeria costaricensis TaxID=2026604 RepID=UPI000C08391F|nr:cysteine desulfurase family protein [Listeria costaricensis]